MRLIITCLGLMLPMGLAVGCSSSETSCDGPGDCSAGAICTDGVCQAVLTPDLDVGTRADANMSLYDAGPVVDTGPGWQVPDTTSGPEDASGPPLVDTGGGGFSDAGLPADVIVPVLDVPMAHVLTLGDACTVPDFNQGEVDGCSIDNPNYYCLASLDGQTAYCSAHCTIDEEEGHEGDAGINLCGSGCCYPIPAEPGQPPVPGEQQEGACRFAPDCD